MKRKLFPKLLTLCFLFAILLSSCTPKPEYSKFTAYSMDYFDTVTTIIGYEKTQEDFDAVSDEILVLLGEYHRLYTIYHRFDGLENLCTVNELIDGSHRTVAVDQRIIDLLLYAREMHTLTGGIVNIAMGSVLSIWHDCRTAGMNDPAAASLPPMEILQEAAGHTDIRNMVIDEENNTVTLTDPLMTLDVGAIAKGYAVERIAQELEERGISGYVLNVGGNIRSVGVKPDASSWTIGIENPSGGDYLAFLQLNGQAVVTSGSYQRYYTVGGKTYHHIIHPETLMPAEGFVSVSVVSPHSGYADALSTALFCLPLEEGLRLVESLPDLEALWVSDDGTKTESSGWNQYVQN